VKRLQLLALVLLLGGCDGAKALYEAVAATGDHTKPPIPLAVLMSAAPQASGSPGASATPSFFPTTAPTAVASVRPTPAPSAASPAAASAAPSPSASPSVAAVRQRYNGSFFTLEWDPQHWTLAEASIEQALMGDAVYLKGKDVAGVRMAIVDDPRAKPFERLRDEAVKRMARVIFARDASLSGQEAWEAYGLIGASATQVDEDAQDDKDLVAAPDGLDAALGKVTYYLSSTRDGRTYGLRLELDGTLPTSAAEQRVELARKVAISWRWTY